MVLDHCAEVQGKEGSGDTTSYTAYDGHESAQQQRHIPTPMEIQQLGCHTHTPLRQQNPMFESPKQRSDAQIPSPNRHLTPTGRTIARLGLFQGSRNSTSSVSSQKENSPSKSRVIIKSRRQLFKGFTINPVPMNKGGT